MSKEILKEEDFSKKSFLDYVVIPDHDVYQKADKFNDLTTWAESFIKTSIGRVSKTGSGARMSIVDSESNGSKEMINFSGNDYLNLAKHPHVIGAAKDALTQYGAGAGSAPLLGGNSIPHIELAKKVAKLKSCEDAIIHPSGYASNLGCLQAMLKKDDLAIIDQYAHASIADGCNGAVVRTFKHNDMRSLESILKLNSKGKGQTKIICVDGVYSMDGDIAPLPDICEIAKRYGAYVYVDDAHAVGVIGKTGKGTCEYFGMEGEVDIMAGTFSKALGSQGGYLAASKKLINYLKYYSRAYLFSTGMMPSVAAASSAAIDVLLNEPHKIDKLKSNIKYLNEKLINAGFNIGKVESAIFPIIIGDRNKLYEVCNYLYENGILVNPVTFPAVPLELSRVRVSITQDHTMDELDKLVNCLTEKCKAIGIM